MPPYRPLPDVELVRLSDDELVAHISRAKRAEDRAQARLALQVLVFAHLDDLERRARMKLPAHAVEQVVGEAFLSALRAALDGESQGEFHNWLHRILDRRIADHYRKPRVPTEPLSSDLEPADDEGPRGAEPATDDETGAVEVRLVVDRVLGALRPCHRQVVDLYVFSDLPAREVAERVTAEPAESLDAPMNENNVHKIAERFRSDLRAELGGADTS